jgi:CTP synthase
LLCRSEFKLSKEVRQKIALFCSVEENSVVEVVDVDNTIYEVPIMFAKRGLEEIVLKKLNLPESKLEFDTWTKFVNRIKSPKHEVTIALVGKYTKYRDSYKSILEAFIHAGSINNTRVNVELINAESITEETVDELLGNVNGILVGPGFGHRGIEGKITAIKYVREHNIPFFGICLGMQCAVIEFARNVCGMADANSGEFEKSEHNVIDMMEEQKKITNKGGTMRLGAYPCTIEAGTKAFQAYKSYDISERHRHRYELNNTFKDDLVANGMIMSGHSPDGHLVEIVELKNHLWFVGVQFHPELKSRAVTGHPLFISFIKAALQSNNKTNRNKKAED